MHGIKLHGSSLWFHGLPQVLSGSHTSIALYHFAAQFPQKRWDFTDSGTLLGLDFQTSPLWNPVKKGQTRTHLDAVTLGWCEICQNFFPDSGHSNCHGPIFQQVRPPLGPADLKAFKATSAAVMAPSPCSLFRWPSAAISCLASDPWQILGFSHLFTCFDVELSKTLCDFLGFKCFFSSSLIEISSCPLLLFPLPGPDSQPKKAAAGKSFLFSTKRTSRLIRICNS